MKHTPGPWWVDDDDFVVAESGDTCVTIADPHCTNDLDTGEMSANARLIAEAPVMATTLEDCLSWITEYGVQNSDPGAMMLSTDILDVLRKAGRK